MEEKLKKLVASTKLKVHPEDYTIVGLPLDEELDETLKTTKVFSYIVDDSDKTLILTTENWNKISSSFPDAKVETPYRLITLDIVLEWDVVGYMAEISRALADAGISIGAISAYSKDHILVKGSDIEKTKTALEELIERCKK